MACNIAGRVNTSKICIRKTARAVKQIDVKSQSGNLVFPV